MKLLPYATAILNNVAQKGLSRYDPTDIDIYLAERRGTSANDMTRKFFRGLDILCPHLLRKSLSIPKTVFVTAYYHLGMALLSKEQCQIPIESGITSEEMAEAAIHAHYDPDSSLWLYPYAHVSDGRSALLDTGKRVTMHMHGLARLNILLLALWKQYQREDFLKIAVNSSIAVMRQHNITEYDDGSASISYYYNSTDNTLNVNAEFLQWIADIPADQRQPEVEMLGHRILKMLLREQNEDGSFYYCGKEYMQKNRIDPVIDNHHSSYMLSNLIHVLESDFPTPEERIILLRACEQGMEYSLSQLFDEQTGYALYAINTPRRKAETVTYSEACIAFCAYLRSSHISSELQARIRKILPKVMKQLMSLINLNTGSAPSMCVYGRWSHLDSIRWGNGPALQAIFDYVATEQRGS